MRTVHGLPRRSFERRAEYAQPPEEWKLEDREAVRVYGEGGANLLRQIIHGGSGYNDPIVALPGRPHVPG